MPAARSPKKGFKAVNFRSVKRNVTRKSPKKGGKAQTTAEPPPLSSDIESVTDDDDFEPLETPGSKLDEGRYEAYHRSMKPMRGIARPIHTEGQTRVHEILRIFDLTDEYGPCVGVSRLRRWERAHKAGLNPPIQIKEILDTIEGQKDETYSQNVFYHEV